MQARPNILWIVTTQWRGMAMGCAGDRNARTPWLDALAADAVNYTQAITPHPLGPQARAALLTGRLAEENGVRGYWDSLPTEARTVAHALGDRGYATAYFGKWHLAPRDRTAALVGEAHARQLVPPERRGGFAFWEGFESGFLLNDPWLHGTRLDSPRHFKGYQADVLCRRAAEWVTEEAEPRALAANEPWFCVVSLEPPHPPYHAAAARVHAMSPAEVHLRDNVPRGGEVEEKARHELAGYYAHIEATDAAVGALLARVPRDTTAVVFTSVHGDMHGSHGVFRKAWPYEESIRVPLLVRLPGGGRARKEGATVSLVDVSHMAVAWAEGREWHCKRDTAAFSMPEPAGLPGQCPESWRGLRSENHKLVLRADGTPWLYFDLEQDPLEQKNLVSSPAHAAAIARWRQWL